MLADQLELIFEDHNIQPEARAEIRRFFALVRKDAERQGYSEGWDEGQMQCERG